MRKLFLFSIGSLLCVAAKSQTKALSDTSVLEEVVVSANKTATLKTKIAQKIDVISASTIAKYNAQNTGDLLINTGNVFVQKSQQGGSSPVLRGFEASRVLLIVDGVRLNNAIFRAGHLQNSITVDQNMLEQVEVMYGPASTIYGSDALGGVIHFRTKQPKLATDVNLLTSGSAFVRYSSANEEKTVHSDVSIGGKKWAWLQSYNYSDFGDMKMGNNYPDKYPNFGRRSQYITRINGIDSIVKNENDRVQKFSGYKQWDITQKILFSPSTRVKHLLNLQLSNTTNIPRYDRLQDIRNNALRFAEWYYGPQQRIMGAYEFSVQRVGWFDELSINLNHQDIKESRQTRDYRRYDRFDSRREHVKVSAYSVDLKKKWGKQQLTIGTDAQLNDLKSVADRTNLNTGAVTKLDTRYPDGKNKMNFFGLYAQHSIELSNKLILNEGIRLQTIQLKSTLVDNSFFNLPFTDISQKSSAVTGNAGLVYRATSKSRINFNFSSGFRAPNIDDLAKIFESSTSARQVVFPNPNIKPEYTYNFDLGITQRIGQVATIELTGFYTLFRNALVKAPFKLNGQDSVLYNGVLSQVLATQNINKATVQGLSANLTVNIAKGLVLYSTINYTKGRFKTDASKTSAVYQKQANGTYALVQANVSSKPLDHIPPVFGKTSLTYTHSKFTTELFLLYNGAKKLTDYNADGEDNAQYATADGMPGWTTVNWRGNVQINRSVLLQVAVENIGDRNYRYFASGFSAPGRNVMVALRVGF